MGMQALGLLHTETVGIDGDNTFAPDVDEKFWPLRDKLIEVQTQTGLDPKPYESVEQYLNRALAASGGKFTVEDIHTDKVFGDTTINPEEFEDMKFKEAYKTYMDKFFDKAGPMKDNWVLEGESSVKYADIKDLPAREVFRGIENGITPKDIAAQLGIPLSAGERLFDFFQETKRMSETNLGQFYVDGKMTLHDVLQAALKK